MDAHLQSLKDELALLEQAQKDNDESGAVDTFKKADTLIKYTNIQSRIRILKEKIITLEVNGVK